MLSIVTLFLSLAAASDGEVDRVAAVVGDEVIALSEVYEIGSDYVIQTCPGRRPSCVRQVERDILDSLILRVLIKQELASLGQDVSAEDLRRTLDEIAGNNNFEDQSGLRRAIEASGEQWEVYRDEIRQELRQGRFQNWIIAPRIPVSEDELVDAYRRTVREMEGPGKVRFEAITLPVDTEAGPTAVGDAVMGARELWEQLESGALSWEDAVAQHHSGAISGPNADALPAVAPGSMVPALDTVIFGTELGEVAEPVVAGGNVFIVRPVEREAAEVASFESVRAELEQQVKAAKAEVEVQQWYLQQRREAAVRVLLEEV